MRNRGVSEVVGFVLVFSLVIATISFVYVGGFASLTDSRDSERAANAERAMDVLAGNFQQLGRGNAPSRATEIRIADASIRTSSNRHVSTNATPLASSQTANPVSIEYSTGSSGTIAYESGAVIRTDGGGSVMLRDPDFVFDENRTVIRYIEPRGARQSISGTTTILVRGIVRDSSVQASASDPDGMTVEFAIETVPERTDVWVAYLEREMPDPSCDVDEGSSVDQITCQFETESLHVSRTRVSVTII